MEKLCRICGHLMSLENFTIDKFMKDGYRNECKKCSNKIYNDPERRKELNLARIVKTEGEKKCRICNEVKDINQYHIKRGTPDGHRSECKECIKSVLKKYKEAPDFKEKRSEYDKNRYQELREDTIERMREYRKDNKDEVNKRSRERRKDPRVKEIRKKWFDENKDVMAEHQKVYRERYPHIVVWRSILYSTLKRMGTQKEGHTIDMLGYSAVQLKHHIEKQFTKGMSWENHGEWHIDHIISVIDFSIDTPVNVVCALSNLRPMWGTTREIDGITYEGNLNKGSRSDNNIYDIR